VFAFANNIRYPSSWKTKKQTNKLCTLVTTIIPYDPKTLKPYNP